MALPSDLDSTAWVMLALVRSRTVRLRSPVTMPYLEDTFKRTQRYLRDVLDKLERAGYIIRTSAVDHPTRKVRCGWIPNPIKGGVDLRWCSECGTHSAVISICGRRLCRDCMCGFEDLQRQIDFYYSTHQ